MAFDPSFAHKYPAEHGLFEGEEEGSRVIRTGDTSELPSEVDSFTYPFTDNDGYRTFKVPQDARGLAAYSRLMMPRGINIESTGRLLGVRLEQVNRVMGGIPEDVILPRFSVSVSEAGDARYGGIDIRLLPPFNGLGGNINDVTDMVRADLETIGQVVTSHPGVIGRFLTSIEAGISDVG